MYIPSSFIKCLAIFGLAGQALVIYSIYEYFAHMMPSWVALVDIEEDNEAEEKQLIKKFWGRYLVSDSDEKNISWWNWSFKENDFTQARTDEFKKVTKGFSDDTKDPIEIALNRVCKRKYEDLHSSVPSIFEFSKFVEYILNDTNLQNLFQDIWSYCSIGGVKLITLRQNGDEKQIKDDYKALFASTKETTNLWWWVIREKEFNSKKIEDLRNYPDNKTTSLLGECSRYYYNQSPTIVTDVNALALCGIGIPIRSIYDYID